MDRPLPDPHPAAPLAAPADSAAPAARGRLRRTPDARRLRALLLASNDLTLILDGTGPDALVGPAPTRRRFDGRLDLDALLARVHPDDRGDVRRAVEAARQGATAPDGQCLARLHLTPGRWTLAEVRVRDLRGAPEVGGIVVLASEVEAREAERLALQERLAHLATHDELTGLWNRTGFCAALEDALGAAHPPGAAAVFFIDLDDFGLINEGLGHDLGDRLLQTVAARLEGTVGPCDTVGRFGGDEFIVLAASRASREAVIALAEACRAAIAAPVVLGGRRVYATASLGVAWLRGQPSPDLAIQEAAVAMYAAKSSGRDRAAVFDGSMHASLRRRAAIGQALRRALGAGELGVEYQPKHALVDGALVGFEALLRWRAPEGLGARPDEFVPIAEELGLMEDIGAWCAREAIGQLAAWRRKWRLHAGLTMAVNLSYEQIRTAPASARFVDVVRGALDEHGVPGELVEVELTERALSSEAPSVRSALDALRAMGVRVAVDDFGTGYSSLAALRDLPIDALKIDRSFLAGLGTDPVAAQIVSFVVALARALGAVSVAEGIERAEQVPLLREIGADIAQGYLYAPPLSTVACEELLGAAAVRARAGAVGTMG